VVAAAGVGLEAALWLIGGTFSWTACLWSVALLCLFAYVARGVQHSKLGSLGILVLLYAPVYVFWKLFIARPFGAGGTKRWIRTRRESK